MISLQESSLNIPENIAQEFDHLEDKNNRSAIFQHFRENDESHLFPIFNSFNASDRAIQRLYRFEKAVGYYLIGLELALWLDTEISTIVNNYL